MWALSDARCGMPVIEGLLPLSVKTRATNAMLVKSRRLARHGDASQSDDGSEIDPTQRVAVVMRSSSGRAQRSRARNVNAVVARLANDTVHFDPRRLFQFTALSSVIGSLTGRRLGLQR